GREKDPGERLAALESWTREHLPVGAARHAWAAQDWTTDTGLPFVGPAYPGDERVLVATGYAKWGLTTGAAAGLALAGRVLGEAPAWAATLEPWARPPRPTTSQASTLAEQTAGWACAATRPTGQRAGARRVSRVCPHLGAVVRWNEQEQSWDCPAHGSRFAADGTVLDGPATEPLAPRWAGRRRPDVRARSPGRSIWSMVATSRRGVGWSRAARSAVVAVVLTATLTATSACTVASRQEPGQATASVADALVEARSAAETTRRTVDLRARGRVTRPAADTAPL